MDGTRLQIIGIVGNILMVLGYFPQIFKTIKTHEAEDISLISWLSYLLGDLCLLIYAILTNDGVFVSLFTLFTVGNFTIVALTIKYGKIRLGIPKSARTKIPPASASLSSKNALNKQS
jgi:uncharacterized protein with PQ loop repeat